MEQDWKEEINGGTKKGGRERGELANAVVCVLYPASFRSIVQYATLQFHKLALILSLS
jgi:hypothetical protein